MRAKVQRRLKCDTAGALPFIHREPQRRGVVVGTPKNLYKEEKLAKDGGEKAASSEQSSREAEHNRGDTQQNEENRRRKKVNGTTAVLHWGTQRKLCDPI